VRHGFASNSRRLSHFSRVGSARPPAMREARWLHN
jgi:hypothetical protein